MLVILMMNLAINPLNFNNQFSNLKNKKETSKLNYNPESNSLMDFNCAFALKNQILFKGTFEKESSEDVLRKYNLKLYPETFEQIAKCKKISDSTLSRLGNKGQEIFTLFLRGALMESFPYKTEGELNDLCNEFSKSHNITRISRELFEGSFDLSDEESKNRNYSRKFYAIIGALVADGGEEGYLNALEFLYSNVFPIMTPYKYKNKKNPTETFYDFVSEIGLEKKDFKIRTRMEDSKYATRVFYKNNKIAIAKVPIKGGHKRQACKIALEEAMEKIRNKKLILDDYEFIEMRDYANPDLKRKEHLEEFCQKYGLKFNDINLLHKSFLAGVMPNGDMLQKHEQYELLEFLGDGILQFCTHEILAKNLEDTSKQTIGRKLNSFVSNENLAKLFKENNFEEYIITATPLNEKRYADMFEALIGAIYIDGGTEGINEVYRFLDDNFRDEILGI